MSEIITPIPFGRLMRWIFEEYRAQGSIFGIRKEKFYRNKPGCAVTMFGDKLASPVGPAAGPHAQLAQNIIAAYLCGGRFIELKTVQRMDGEELRKCVARPCINAKDEGYNVEWSTELTVQEAFAEYVKAWFAIQVVAKELEISDTRDFAYNMSVGYDLGGIRSDKIDGYIEGMKDASGTDIWRECVKYLEDSLPLFKRFDARGLQNISPKICSSITLSTLHGCPPDEIERIARYLLGEKHVHTYIKLNPTLLGYERARSLLDRMGYGYVAFDDHHFKNDLQFGDAVEMLERLMAYAKELELDFGVKLTNTFPVQIEQGELPGEEMYMSGRALYPLTLTAADMLCQKFGGALPVPFSGGADAFNIEDILKTGVQPVTVATTILKPGGYERLNQLADLACQALAGSQAERGIDVSALHKLAKNVIHNENHIKVKRMETSRKTDSGLPLFDCFKAPCHDGGCPVEQQIPQYLKLVSEGKYDEAFHVIAIDNACPSVTGAICNHACQTNCTRIYYDSPLCIRDAKRLAAEKAQDAFIDEASPTPLKTDKKAVIIGAGPGGISAALFLRRAGVDVTVLEKRARPFGAVQYVIPEFRISSEAIRRDFRMAEKIGVKFVFNAPGDYDIERLKEEYDFVILATGAWKEGTVPFVQGAEKTRGALAFLEESKASGCKTDLGKKVAVIGGGDVAMDCARAAKAAPGVEEVVIVYRRTKGLMPAQPEEIRLAEEDGAVFMELLSPVSYDGNTLTCERMELGAPDASGRQSVKGTGVTEGHCFDTVICAVGARVDTALFTRNRIATDDAGNVVANAACETSVTNVYAVGDCRAGASTIVSAMADSKAAAKDILKNLGLADGFIKADVSLDVQAINARRGVLAPMGAGDALRCLACGQVCEICREVCPNRANVAVAVPGFRNEQQMVHIDGMCNECGNCATFCPHGGKPYREKFTLYWSEEAFDAGESPGFVLTTGGKFKIRHTDGITETDSANDERMPNEVRAVISAVIRDYPYYIIT